MRFLSSAPCRMPVSRHRSRCFHSARYRENDKGMGRGPRPRACTHFQAGFLHFAIPHTTHYMRKAAMPPRLFVCILSHYRQYAGDSFVCFLFLYVQRLLRRRAGYPAKLAIILVLVSQFGYIKLHLLGSIGMYRIGIPNNKLFLRYLTIGIGDTVFCLCFSHKRPWLFC